MTAVFGRAKSVDPLLDSYVEPCPWCHVGEHAFCDDTLEHALDEYVPCPCRIAGHSSTQERTP